MARAAVPPRSTRWWVFSLAWTGVCAGLAHAQGTFFLKPEQVKDVSSQGVVAPATVWINRADEKPKLKGLPEDLGRRVYYYQASLGGADRVFLIESGTSRKLYVDTDADNDLSDEKPLKSERVKSSYSWGWSRSYRFGPITLAGNTKAEEGEDKAAGDESKGGAFLVEQFDQDYLVAYPAIYLRGKIRAEDESYAVALIDANLNGRYDDAFKPTKENLRSRAITCDSLAIDWNGDGNFAQDYGAASEVQGLPRLLRIKDTYYSVKLEPNAVAITLEKADPKMGTLDIGKLEVELLLMSDTGLHRLTGTGPWQLPVGQYGAFSVMYTRPDEKRGKWTLHSSGSLGKLAEFGIDEARTTTIKAGPPLKVKVTQHVQKRLFSGRVVNFNVALVDQADVDFGAGARKDGNRMPAPSVKIVDEAGKTLSAGKFEYG